MYHSMEQSSNGTIGTYKKLSSKDKETLAILKGTPVMDIIIKAIDIYQKDQAAFSMAMSPNWEHVLSTRGQILGSRFIVDLVNYTSQAREKDIAAKKAIETTEPAK